MAAHKLDIGPDDEEELADLPAELKAKDPLFKMKIMRPIGGKVFTGQVEDIEVGKVSGERLYRIRYCDGDLEHFTAQQVQEFQHSELENDMDAGPAMKKPAATKARSEESCAEQLLDEGKADAIVKKPAAAAEAEAEEIEIEEEAPVSKKPAAAEEDIEPTMVLKKPASSDDMDVDGDEEPVVARKPAAAVAQEDGADGEDEEEEEDEDEFDEEEEEEEEGEEDDGDEGQEDEVPVSKKPAAASVDAEDEEDDQAEVTVSKRPAMVVAQRPGAMAANDGEEAEEDGDEEDEEEAEEDEDEDEEEPEEPAVSKKPAATVVPVQKGIGKAVLKKPAGK